MGEWVDEVDWSRVANIPKLSPRRWSLRQGIIDVAWLLVLVLVLATGTADLKGEDGSSGRRVAIGSVSS